MFGKSFAVSSMLLVVLLAGLTSSSYAQQKPVLSGPIDDSVRVTIPGSRHPLAQPQFDAGTLDPGTKLDRMLLVLAPSPQQQAELQKLLDSQQDKSSPNYHHWLTPDEFGQKFGPAPQDIAAVKTWLAQQGFTVGATAHSGLWIEFSGTAGQAEHAFHTLLRHYNVGQGSHIANATDISLPAAMAPVVQGVASLHNFFKKPMLAHYFQAAINGDGTYTPINPDATLNSSSGPVHALTPGDYANIYQLNPLYTATPTAFTGAGQTIAIVARSDANFSDFSDFRRITGTPAGTLINTVAAPPDPGFDTVTGDGVEVDLDAEWAGGIAPGATINVVASASTATTDGVDLSAAFIVDHNVAPVMSASFGDCESDLGAAENAFFNNLWLQAAAQGISVMVSSGDTGAAGCDFIVQSTAAKGGLAVSGLASTPFNTAVGGTQFQEGGNDASFWNSTNTSTGVSAKGYIPEVAWNEVCNPTVANSPCASAGLFVLASGGGGTSTIYPKPSWQNVSGIPNDLVRDVPDISLTAATHDGYVICFDFSCGSNLVAIVGGTSASSPSFAGMMAIVNQVAGRQGLPNYKLYELAQKPNALCNSATRTTPSVPPPSNCIFNDVTSGDNGVPGQSGFTAASGFDLATGLGSINAANLVNAWKNISLLSTSIAISSAGTSTISAVHGQAVPLSVSVTGSSGVPSGSVALASSTTGPVSAVTIAPSTGNVAAFDGTISNLPGGTYTLTGHYPGDGQFAASDSNGISVTVTPEASTTNLRVFGISSTGLPVASTSLSYGSFMDFHADVAGASGKGTPSGSVNFVDTTTAQGLGSGVVNLKGESEVFFLPGTLNSIPPPLTLGVHTLTASYSGDTSFNAGTSAPLAITITKGNPTVAIDPTNGFVATQAGNLNAFVDPLGPIFPTGTMQFFDGGTALGAPLTIAPNSDQVVLQTTFANEGQHSITVSYSGDATYNAAVSQPLVVTVFPPFTIETSNTSVTMKAGQSIAVPLTLITSNTPSTFSGSVALTCAGSEPAITCTPSVASISLSSANSGAQFTLNISSTTSASLHGKPFFRWPGALAGVVAVVLAGFSRKSKAAFAVVSMALVLGIVSCGGGGSTPPPPPPPPPPTHASVIVTGTSGSHVATLTLNLTITH